MEISNWDNIRPTPDEYNDKYEQYISLITATNVIDVLISQQQATVNLIQNLSPAEANYRYQKDKWSVQQVIGHLIDNERVMAYRAMCISRGEETALPGYDQEKYVAGANFEKRDLHNMAVEYEALRTANIKLFNSFTPEQIGRTGTIDDSNVSVCALVYIIAGHEKHHQAVIEEKYDIQT